MIILDTNVLGALMRTVPDAAVVACLDRQPADSALDNRHHIVRSAFRPCVTSIRSSPAISVCRLPKEDLENRVLDFESAAAIEAASLAATRRKMGRPVDMRDTQTAACGACYPKRSALLDLEISIVDPSRD